MTASSVRPFAIPEDAEGAIEGLYPRKGETYRWFMRDGRSLLAKVLEGMVDSAGHPIWFYIQTVDPFGFEDGGTPFVLPWPAIDGVRKDK